jgi:hypothetical protein
MLRKHASVLFSPKAELLTICRLLNIPFNSWREDDGVDNAEANAKEEAIKATVFIFEEQRFGKQSHEDASGSVKKYG